MKKQVKKLQFKKNTITSFNSKAIIGGVETNADCTGTGILSLGCPPGTMPSVICGNSVPVAQGGIGCHIK